MNVSELDIKKCSGCAMCMSICAKKCITILPDNMGYMRPVVNSEICIDCGLCVKKCIIANPAIPVVPQDTYAAIRSDEKKISLSSSGGVFAAIAEKVLQTKGWLVVGSSLDETISAKHVVVDNITDLTKLYGSKYVQSETTGIYERVYDLLRDGKTVLFSGTPCQVAAVQRYTKNHENLFTVEVICHGVANNMMFNSYLDMYNRRDIKMFYFRDKGQGWSFNNKIVYKNGKELRINHRLSSYMTYFLNGETYRDSCYHCPYAKPERVADLTIGDFWGIVRKRSDLKDKINIQNGVSCLLINSDKGRQLVMDSDIYIYPVNYMDIKDGNEPLNHPSTHSIKRNDILKAWVNHLDWSDVNNYWKKNEYRVIHRLWSIIPISLQHKIRLLLGKR